MYNGLQQLRFYAAALVVISHSIMATTFTLGKSAPSWVAWLNGIGVVGVEIFFVISGFIMAQSVKMSTNFELSGMKNGFLFFLKRVRRLWPLYFVLTTIAALLSKASFSDYLASLAFLSQPITQKQPTIAYGGTLEYEMFFYLVISVVIMIPVKGKLWISSLCLLGFVLSGFVSSSVINFIIGFIVYFIALRLKKRLNVGYILILLGVVFLFWNWLNSDQGWRQPGWLFFGIPTGLVVLGIVISGIGERPKIFVTLGNASYSIYLAQWFCWFAVGWLNNRKLLPNWIGPDLFILISVPAVIAFGYFCYRILEEPLDRKLRVLANQW